jgi:hypothetical protein
MIYKQDVACFTIETAVGSSMSSVVLRALTTGEGKVNQDVLPRNGCFASGVGTRQGFLQLGGKANGAKVEDGIRALEVRNTINMLVCGIEIGVTGVPE